MISYRGSDHAVAKEIYDYLRQKGISCWIDQEGIKPGSKWRDELLQVLRTSDSCVSILSPRYIESEYCRTEVFIARSLGKKIFPVMVEDCAATLEQYEETRNLNDTFTLRLHHLNVMGIPITKEEGLSRLADAILRLQTLSAPVSGSVYISYTADNAEYATKLSRRLNARQIQTWVATLDCRFGDQWREAQARAIMLASAHLIVLDENMIKSNDILHTEVLLSEAVGNPIFGVLPPRLSKDPSAGARIRYSLESDFAHKTYRRIAERAFFSTVDDENTMIDLLALALQGAILDKSKQ
jgi:hypothetical protein